MQTDALTAFLDALPARYGFPGCDCVILQDHRQIYRHFAGYTDAGQKKPVQGDELYYLYSCTKPVTAVAGLQLLERGKFLLSDPVADYLPAFSSLRVKAGNYTKTPGEPLRISHLFTMTSGFPYALTSAYIQDVTRKTDGRCPTGETVAAIAKIPLESEPGTHWYYGFSHDILAYLIATVSGMDFSEYVKKNIFIPLGMNESTFRLTDEVRQRLAPLCRYDEKTRRSAETAQINTYVPGREFESGGAGMISSLSDYARFADALANGGTGANGARILSPASIALMQSDWLPESAKPDFNWPELAGYTYGLGVRVMRDPVAGGSLSPVGEFGWNGACGHYLLVDPKNRLAVFLARHCLNSRPAFVEPRLRNLVYGALGE